jgi:DnaK suppressor protein
MEMQKRSGTSGSKPVWNAREMEHFEKRLQDERRRAVAQMEQFGHDLRTSQGDSDGEVASWRFHMADEGTDTYEREQGFLMASREGRLLWHIDEALRLLYKSPERYGRCDECGTEIAYERLDAIPYLKNCVSCKQGWEGGQAD